MTKTTFNGTQPTRFWRERFGGMVSQAYLLGLRVDAMPPAEAVEKIRTTWRVGAKARVFFVNAHCMNTSAQSKAYREALEQAEYVLPDGSGVLLAAKMLNLPIWDNLNGTDLTPMLCEAAAQDGRSIYLLGAEPGVAEQAAGVLQQRYPNLRIAGIQHGFFKPEETDAVIAKINAAHPDMLIVAMGVPNQELWITQHFHELNVPVCIGVGALLDFLSNRFPRAPRMWRTLGIEWMYRLLKEPKRLWRRYLIGNVTYMSRVVAAWAGLAYTAHPMPRAQQQYMMPAEPQSQPQAVAIEVLEPERIEVLEPVPAGKDL
jgi:exopolysaccharide biosynthesis WecB/TagA/CpsF family protein